MALEVKNLPANTGDIRDAGSNPGEGNGNPIRSSCLGNPMNPGVGSPKGGKESDMTECLN